jgi:UMF1 family MFS transporter
LGALAFGLLDDRLGGKITILISLAGLLLVSAIAVVAPNRLWFWIAAIGVGVLAGPVQSASRSLMGRFVPPAKENEFYGFFAFSGKATAFLGPLMLGQLTQWFDSQRAGVASVMNRRESAWPPEAKKPNRARCRQCSGERPMLLSALAPCLLTPGREEP